MTISGPKTLHDTVKPLIYFNCFVGMGAVRLPNQNSATFAFMKFHTVTFTLINWFMIYTTLNSLDVIVDSNHTSPMALMMHRTLVRVNSCISVMAPFFVWLQRKGLSDCGLQMIALDESFQNIFGAPTEYRKQYIHLIAKVIVISLVMCCMGISNTLTSLEADFQINTRSLFMFASIAHALHQPILVMLLLDVNFCFFVGYLTKKFRDMNNCLLRLTKASSTMFLGGRLFIISQNVMKKKSRNEIQDTRNRGSMNDEHRLLQQIRYHRMAHLELCKLSRKINRIFGIQNLLSTGISFVMITGLSYTIYSAFEWDNFTHRKLKEVISTVIWAAIYAFKIWLVNHSCWCLSNEAERTGEIIYELLNARVDKTFQKEVQGFGIQMLQNPLYLNACGFFTLDYTFIQGVIGSITTYLVILIQMSRVSDSPSSGTGLASNGTNILLNQ